MAEATVMRDSALGYPVYGLPYVVTFPILDADGDLVTGAAGLDSERSLNGDTFADCTNEATEIATSSGVYYLSLTAAEMTCDILSVIVKTSTSGAKTTVLTLYPKKLPILLTGTCAATGTTTYLKLPAGAGSSTIDDYYNGALAVKKSATTEVRVISDYIAALKQATVSPAFNASAATCVFDIYWTEMCPNANIPRDVNASLTLAKASIATVLTEINLVQATEATLISEVNLVQASLATANTGIAATQASFSTIATHIWNFNMYNAEMDETNTAQYWFLEIHTGEAVIYEDVNLAQASLSTIMAEIQLARATEATLISEINLVQASMSTAIAKFATIATGILNAALSGTSSTPTSVRVLGDGLRFLRNKWTVSSAGTLTVYKENDSDIAWSAVVSSTATANPIVGNDPA